MYLYDTHCCGIQEIDNLSTHMDGRDAMRSFCSKTFGAPIKFKGVQAVEHTPYSFYMFTEAVNLDGTPRVAWGGGAADYGVAFKQFIETNNLGKVFQSEYRKNKTFHPDRAVRVYIWEPNVDALRAWWTLEQKGGYTPEVEDPPYEPDYDDDDDDDWRDDE